jgi:hypothetical protein
MLPQPPHVNQKGNLQTCNLGAYFTLRPDMARN